MEEFRIRVAEEVGELLGDGLAERFAFCLDLLQSALVHATDQAAARCFDEREGGNAIPKAKMGVRSGRGEEKGDGEGIGVVNSPDTAVRVWEDVGPSRWAPI